MIKTNYKVTRTRLMTLKKVDYVEVLAEDSDMALEETQKKDRCYRCDGEYEKACDVNPGSCDTILLKVDESFEVEEVK